MVTDFANEPKTASIASGRTILKALLRYVSAYEMLSQQADERWGPLQETADHAHSGQKGESDEWKGWISRSVRDTEFLKMSTRQLNDDLDGKHLPQKLKQRWDEYGTESTSAIQEFEDFEEWKTDSEEVVSDHIKTMRSKVGEARRASTVLRHELLAEIRELVSELEDLLKGVGA